MAGKFIPLKQAAEMLGMTADTLNDLRQRGEIHAMRDGNSWKFKREELERVAEELGVTLAESEDEGLLGCRRPGTDRSLGVGARPGRRGRGGVPHDGRQFGGGWDSEGCRRAANPI